jgi:hypothetical protein
MRLVTLTWNTSHREIWTRGEAKQKNTQLSCHVFLAELQLFLSHHHTNFLSERNWFLFLKISDSNSFSLMKSIWWKDTLLFVPNLLIYFFKNWIYVFFFSFVLFFPHFSCLLRSGWLLLHRRRPIRKKKCVNRTPWNIKENIKKKKGSSI